LPCCSRRGASSAGRLGRAALLLTLAASIALAGCGAAPLAASALSADAVVLPLPVVPQDELYECGLAALSSLCQYHRVELPAPVREALVATAAERQGLSGTELRAALEPLGLEVLVFPGTLDHELTGLYRHVDQGRPLLVMTHERFGTPHYGLFAGYDPARGTVYLLDPRRGPVVWPAATFEAHWQRAGRFTLLATPAAAPAATSTVTPAVTPAAR
jgi:ABC-type bacteriocin/lantibiotic exporter with double-glycine peptidase domain